MTEAFDKIQALIKSGEPHGTVWTEVLHLILGQFQSETGTLHRLDPHTQLLHLLARPGARRMHAGRNGAGKARTVGGGGLGFQFGLAFSGAKPESPKPAHQPQVRLDTVLKYGMKRFRRQPEA